MDMNRSRPPRNASPYDLTTWLSGLLNDAQRDATEAGMTAREVAELYMTYAKMLADDCFMSRADRTALVCGDRPCQHRVTGPPDKIVCAVGYVRRGNHVLVRMRKSSPAQMLDLDGAYENPGGKVRVGESVEDGLRREVHEETGLRVERFRLLQIFDDVRTDVQLTATTFFYRVWLERGNPRTERGKSPWEWRTMDEILVVSPDTPNSLLNWLGANDHLVRMLP